MPDGDVDGPRAIPGPKRSAEHLVIFFRGVEDTFSVPSVP